MTGHLPTGPNMYKGSLLAGIVIAGALSACSPLISPASPRSPAPTVPTSYSAKASPADEDISPPPPRSKHRHLVAHSSQKPAPQQPAQAQASVAATKPSVTLDGEDTSRNAKARLDQVDERLGAINRGGLSPLRAKEYDEAHDFASSARQALDDHDYVAAEGFSQKASVLTSLLESSKSSK